VTRELTGNLNYGSQRPHSASDQKEVHCPETRRRQLIMLRRNPTTQTPVFLHFPIAVLTGVERPDPDVGAKTYTRLEDLSDATISGALRSSMNRAPAWKRSRGGTTSTGPDDSRRLHPDVEVNRGSPPRRHLVLHFIASAPQVAAATVPPRRSMAVLSREVRCAQPAETPATVAAHRRQASAA
jgi:hypothetical protein